MDMVGEKVQAERATCPPSAKDVASRPGEARAAKSPLSRTSLTDPIDPASSFVDADIQRQVFAHEKGSVVDTAREAGRLRGLF